jgi:hypothetical protein
MRDDSFLKVALSEILAEGVGFEQSQTNLQTAALQGASLNEEVSASLTASQKPVPTCPELAELCQAWPKLPANIRTAVLGLIRATLNSTAP